MLPKLIKRMDSLMHDFNLPMAGRKTSALRQAICEHLKRLPKQGLIESQDRAKSSVQSGARTLAVNERQSDHSPARYEIDVMPVAFLPPAPSGHRAQMVSIRDPLTLECRLSLCP